MEHTTRQTSVKLGYATVNDPKRRWAIHTFSITIIDYYYYWLKGFKNHWHQNSQFNIKLTIVINYSHFKIFYIGTAITI